jgi:hypothetical protein
VVREVIRDQLQAEGRKIKDIEPEVLEAEIDKFVDQDDVVKEAKKRINARQKKANISLGRVWARRQSGLTGMGTEQRRPSSVPGHPYSMDTLQQCCCLSQVR